MKSTALHLALVLTFCGTAQAQSESEGEDPDMLMGADEIAEAIVSMTSRVWTGPRTSAPAYAPRPRGASNVIRSPNALIAVHAGPEVPTQMLHRVARSLEETRAALDVMGWPSPLSDGSLGGGPEFDLYLRPTDTPTSAHADGLALASYLDRASAFAVMSPRIPIASIDACVAAAYAEALLLSMDPAEAKAWRRATAAFLAWALTGQFGCEEAVFEQQARSHRSWVRGGAAEGTGGAMLLAYLAARHGDGDPAFVRDAWELATQRTWEGSGLRAEPDLWAAIETSIALSGDRLLDTIIDLAVLRWFVGRGDTQGAFIGGIESDAQVPPTRTLRRLPTRMRTPQPLEPFGSAYVVLEGDAIEGVEELRCWLRGEYGVRWSFVAVQIGEDGSELERLTAPPTGAVPESFLPVPLDPQIARVLFVVTNLSSRLPDADEPDANERSFELIVDRKTAAP